MFDIKDAVRLKIYERMALIATGLAGLSAIVTPLVIYLGAGPVAATTTAVLAVVSAVGAWIGKLAANHTPIDAILDAVDSVPGN